MDQQSSHKQQLKNIVLLLICRKGEASQQYLEHLSQLGVRTDLATNYQELYQALMQKRYNGIMIDITTKIRELKEHKESVSHILEWYPFLHLRYDKREKKIYTFFFGQTKGKGNILDFIVLKCLRQNSRKIRLFNQRVNIHLNVWLSKDSWVDKERSERTITVNLSHNGCFLYSLNEWLVNEQVWLIIKELSDQTPIHGIVRWVVQWGESLQMPGIGIEFVSISKSQIDDIMSLV